ncbi:hypothetical protein OXX59_008429 [Metschnikowia pulcherrima]
MIVALFSGALVSSSYVAAIKIAVPKHVTQLERNNPEVIKFRVRRVLGLCSILVFIVPLISVGLGGAPNVKSAIRQMGLLPGFTKSHAISIDLLSIAWAQLKIASLYMGPIFAYIYTEAHFWRADLRQNFATLTGLRDHVFAPITEEFVYRAALLAILKPVLSERSLIYYSPLFFGLAHVHHGFTLYKHEKVPFESAAAASGFQFVYTTLFGILANTFYVKSNYNLWCPIVVHATCNLLGFPSFDVRDTHPRFFYFYCGLLILGMVTFWKLL